MGAEKWELLEARVYACPCSNERWGVAQAIENPSSFAVVGVVELTTSAGQK